MFKNWFGKPDAPTTPSIMGLGLKGSFEVDSLLLELVESEMLIEGCAPTQIIQAVGLVELDGSSLFRFYTDDDAWLQVVVQGAHEPQNVIDVKLFHYWSTLDMSDQTSWDHYLNNVIGAPEYELEGYRFARTWESASHIHPPVHMRETTFDGSADKSVTDQFVMLYERPLSDGSTESLFLSAEETETAPGKLERCMVISTGMTLTPSQITIHG
ncbi:YjfK family protein [Hahella ganghwensis]|uniref:YjfK family protein n=1 Tax=Hahella ganghwensis TaxID=286420 RepID=UPI00035FD41F|nr:YjfK family protein [Hahella ganghwensis]